MLNMHWFGFKYGRVFLDTANLKRKKKRDWLKSLIWSCKTCRPRGCAVLSNLPALPPKPKKRLKLGPKYCIWFTFNIIGVSFLQNLKKGEKLGPKYFIWFTFNILGQQPHLQNLKQGEKNWVQNIFLPHFQHNWGQFPPKPKKGDKIGSKFLFSFTFNIIEVSFLQNLKKETTKLGPKYFIFFCGSL